MTTAPMDVGAFLEARGDAILSTAQEAVMRHRLVHYEAAGAAITSERLRALFDVLVRCCHDHSVEQALQYGEWLAVDRHASGHSLGEVQTAVNVLEEVVWQSLTSDAPPDALGYALGLVSTVLGAVKDRLACTYVSQVSSKPLGTLRLDSLFAGTEGSLPS